MRTIGFPATGGVENALWAAGVINPTQRGDAARTALREPGTIPRTRDPAYGRSVS